jgi:hypothetical protein
MGMAMPIMSIASRAAKKSATRSVMVKIDIAARLFRSDIGPYPWQPSYADLAANVPWTNRLYYQLGTTIEPSDLDKVMADAEAAAALYRKNGISPHAYNGSDARAGSGTNAMANRMASERVRLAVYSGNVDITGGVLRIPYYDWRVKGEIIRRVLPTTPLLSSPASSSKPGWADDYLNGELEQRYISGEAVLDAWKRPLIYIGQIIEGMTSAPILGADGVVECNALDMGLHPLGRTSLAAQDIITNLQLTAHPARLPDLDNLRHSDRRHYAARGLELEFELWSAGPDGRADWMRDALPNIDNVSLLPYDENIP